MAIVFETFDKILVDGVAAGNIVDVISNHAPRRAEILAAFNVFRDALLTRQDEELSAQNAQLLEEKTNLISEKTLLTTQVNNLTSEKDSLILQVTNLTSQKEALIQEKSELITSHAEEKTALINSHQTEKSELVASHAEEKSELILNHLAEKAELNTAHANEKTTLTTALAAANARIVRLTNELPFNPREINVNSFKARLFKVLETEDVVRMYAAEADPILKQIAATIATWDEKDPIRLDSQELQQPLGYLVSIDLLTPEEVVFLRQDCIRSEAYFAPEEQDG